MSSLTRHALGGVAWNYAGAVVLVLTQIVSTVVTARVVSPREFGAYAAAQAAGGIFGYFSLSAVGQAVLRRSELAKGTVGSATAISVLAGALVAAAMWLIAIPWAAAWHVPAAARVVHVLAFTVFLNAVAVMPLTLLRRSLRFRAAAVTETVTQVLGAAAGVTLAVQLHSAFALALGQCAAAATLVLAAGVLARRQLEMRLSWREGKGLATFAGQVTAINFGSYLMNIAPSWYAARAYGARTLGFYSRAGLIVGLPLTYLSSGLMKVLYPLYGRLRSDESRVKLMLEEALALTTGLLWPVLGFIAGAAPVIVSLLLGPRWEQVAPLLALFALAACADLACSLLTNAGEALGWMRTIWNRQIALLGALTLVVGVVHVAGLGVVALVAGVAVAQWLTYGLTVHAFVRRRFLDGRSATTTNLAHAGAAAMAFGVAALTARFLADDSLGIRVLGELAAALIVCGGLVAMRSWFPAGRILARRLEQVRLARPSAGGVVPTHMTVP
jgi:O-antigen/teichoic acid export membrane protein